MKNLSIALASICVGLIVWVYQSSNENYRLKIVNEIYHAEHRILKDELSELERRPTYESGVKDTLIKMGANGTEGWNNGYDAAVSLLANSSYSDGYHQAIFQFGYQKPDTSRFLAPEPKKTKKEEDQTAKITKNN